jgi:hypothetical protein
MLFAPAIIQLALGAIKIVKSWENCIHANLCKM